MSVEKQRPDIDQMITDSGPLGPERDPSKPFEEGEIQDLRSPAQRAKDIREAGEAKEGGKDEGGGSPEAPAAATQPATDDKEKKGVWAAEKKKMVGDFNDLRTRLKEVGEADDPKIQKELLEAKEEMIRQIIEQAAREDSKIATDVLKEGLLVATDKDLHKYAAGMDSVVKKILGRHDYQGYLRTFLEGPTPAEEAIASMQRYLGPKIAELRLRTEKKIEQAPARPTVEKPHDKETGTKEALKPFFMRIKDMLRGKKESDEASDDEQEKTA